MSKNRSFLFTSESVTEGHPDKMADQVSDAVLDAVLSQDAMGRVGCETLFTTGLAMVAGEITTNDQRSMEGIPAIAEIPGINLLFSDTTKMKEDDELLIVMTPHIIANRGLTTSPIWVGSN